MTAAAPTRVPLHDVDAEEAVLGAAMLNANALDVCVSRLTDRDFYRPANGLIFAAISRLYDRSEQVDVVMVSEELRRAGQLGDAGGQMALARLIENTPVPASAASYAEIVRGHALVRRVQSAAFDVFQRGFDPADPADYADRAEADIFAASAGRPRNDVQHISTVLTDLVGMIERAHRGEEVTLGIPTGLRAVDHIIGGMRAGNLILVAARPSIGKSSLGFQVARSVAGTGKRVLLWSIEMSAQEVGLRLLASEAHVPTQHLLAGDIRHEAQWLRVNHAHEAMHDLPILIVEGKSSSPLDVRSAARRLKADLVVLDYVQLLTYPGRHERREEEVSAISRSLKGLAMELHVPVLALAQLNRDPERSGGRDPVLSDLRDSGSLEQDADVVILLSRSGPSQVTAHVAKHRNGPVGKATLRFAAEYAVFEDAPTGAGGGEA